MWRWRQVRFLILLGQCTPLRGPQVNQQDSRTGSGAALASGLERKPPFSSGFLSWFLGASLWGRACGVRVLRRKGRPHGKPAMGRGALMKFWTHLTQPFLCGDSEGHVKKGLPPASRPPRTPALLHKGCQERHKP